MYKCETNPLLPCPLDMLAVPASESAWESAWACALQLIIIREAYFQKKHV